MILIRYLECRQKTKASNMENREQISGIESSRQNDFEGVTVSAGFVRSLQETVLRLERNQQDFIRQLEHANSLAAEYHETATAYHRKYDAALHEIQELKYQHIRETAELAEKLRCAEEETHEEREIKEEHAQQIKCLQQQLTECMIEKNELQSRQHDDYVKAYTTGFDEGENCANDAHKQASNCQEEMSPVSVASPSPREEQRPPIQSFNRCYSESEDEDEYEDEDEDEDEDEEPGCVYYHDGDTESEGEYEYNEECQCLECRELYAANNPIADANPCSCDECCSSQSSQQYMYDVDGNRYIDGKMVPGQSDTDGSDGDYE
jgi:hypothetical protein